MRNILTCLTCLLLAACGTVKREAPEPAAPDQAHKAPVADKHPAGIRFHPVKGLSNKITGPREVMKASVKAGRSLPSWHGGPTARTSMARSRPGMAT